MACGEIFSHRKTTYRANTLPIYRCDQTTFTCFSCDTSNRLPIELVFLQDFQTRGEGLECERQVKKWSRKKKEALIEQKWDFLQLSAKKIYLIRDLSIQFSKGKITRDERAWALS